LTGSILNMVAFYHDLKGEGHAYKDIGGREAQDAYRDVSGRTTQETKSSSYRGEAHDVPNNAHTACALVHKKPESFSKIQIENL